MNEILLINRLNPEHITEERKRVFFILEKTHLPPNSMKLMDILNKSDILNTEDIVYKNNGVELTITVEEIPEIVKLLVEKGIPIYSVFERYDPKL